MSTPREIDMEAIENQYCDSGGTGFGIIKNGSVLSVLQERNFISSSFGFHFGRVSSKSVRCQG
jgi:hypothetical protein